MFKNFVVGLQPTKVARIAVAGDVSDLFSSWRRRYGMFVPVVAYFADRDQVLDAMALIEPRLAVVDREHRWLPAQMMFVDAAMRFGWMPISPENARPVFNQLARVSDDPKAKLLFRQWTQATGMWFGPDGAHAYRIGDERLAS